METTWKSAGALGRSQEKRFLVLPAGPSQAMGTRSSGPSAWVPTLGPLAHPGLLLHASVSTSARWG